MVSLHTEGNTPRGQIRQRGRVSYVPCQMFYHLPVTSGANIAIVKMVTPMFSPLLSMLAATATDMYSYFLSQRIITLLNYIQKYIINNIIIPLKL
jgi:hypothetical protein